MLLRHYGAFRSFYLNFQWRLSCDNNLLYRVVTDFDEINAGCKSAITYLTTIHAEYAYFAVVTAFHNDIAVLTPDENALHVKFVDADGAITSNIAILFKIRSSVGDVVASGK